MTIDERLEALAVQLDTLTRIHIDNDREFRERFDRLTDAQEKNTRDIEALARDIGALARDIGALKTVVEHDTDNVRSLIRIAELHHERLNRLER